MAQMDRDLGIMERKGGEDLIREETSGAADVAVEFRRYTGRVLRVKVVWAAYWAVGEA